VPLRAHSAGFHDYRSVVRKHVPSARVFARGVWLVDVEPLTASRAAAVMMHCRT